MKRISRKIQLTLSILLLYSSGYSQGLRLDGICYSGINVDYLSPAYWGLSYDHNVDEKLCLSFSYRTPFSSTSLYSIEESYGYSTADGDVSYKVYHSNEWQEFAFTSKYFFSDNSDGSYYVASAISLMSATNYYTVAQVTTTGSLQPSQIDIVPGDYKQSVTFIPLALDLGHRSTFDGFYFEVYTGVQFLPFGGNSDIDPSFLANHGVEMKYNSFSIHAGLCLGFSWAK